MKSLEQSVYETPMTEVLDFELSNIICISGGEQGGGNDDYENGGEV